jgi:uncharacterized membrane protein YhaH (DUF805 family)
MASEASLSIWQAIAGFSGRISRVSFWRTLLLLFPASWAFFAAVYWLMGGHWNEGSSPTVLSPEVVAPARLISSVVFLYPFVWVSIKRLHDLNLSGWWCVPVFALDLIDAFAPAFGLLPPDSALDWTSSIVFLALLVVLSFRGTPGPNRYGDHPRGILAAVSSGGI